MYYNCYDCGDSLPAYDLLNCEEKLGGIRNAIVLSCDSELTDPSNATEVQAEIDAGRATVIKNAKFGVPASSPVQVDSKVANQPQRVTRYDSTADYINPNVSSTNDEFHNVLFSGKAFGGIIFHELENDTVTWINEAIRATGNKVIPDNDGDTIHYAGTFTWQSKNDEVIGMTYDAPAGIFD